MDDVPAESQRYALSFTTGALLAREAAALAPVYLEQRDWRTVRDLAARGNLLQSRTSTSGVRVVRETVKRLSALTDDEIDLLTDSTASERAHLMWVAACRRYELIGDFAEEVVRERFLLLTPTLDHRDFDAFIRSKAIWHEELVEIKESTLAKLRSNVFRMLQQAELLSAAGHIMPALLSERVATALGARTLSDLRYFPIRQTEQQRASL